MNSENNSENSLENIRHDLQIIQEWRKDMYDETLEKVDEVRRESCSHNLALELEGHSEAYIQVNFAQVMFPWRLILHGLKHNLIHNPYTIGEILEINRWKK